MQALLQEAPGGDRDSAVVASGIGRFSRFRSGKHLARLMQHGNLQPLQWRMSVRLRLVNASHTNLQSPLIQLAKPLPRSREHLNKLAQKLRRSKAAIVLSAAIARCGGLSLH